MTVPLVIISSPKEIEVLRIDVANLLFKSRNLLVHPEAQGFNGTLEYASFDGLPEKLEDWVTKREVDFVVQILGKDPGSAVNDSYLERFFKVEFTDGESREERISKVKNSRKFSGLINDLIVESLWPEGCDINKNFRDWRDLTNTHLEAYLAIQAKKPLVIYTTEDLQAALEDNEDEGLSKKVECQLRHIRNIEKLMSNHHHTVWPSNANGLDVESGVNLILEAVKTACPDISRADQVAPSMTKLREVMVEAKGGLLVGRSDEQKEISHALASNHKSLVTLVGPGGIGKSTLVQDWLNNGGAEGWLPGFGYTFSDPDAGDSREGAGEFLELAVNHFEKICGPCPKPSTKAGENVERAHWLANRVRERRIVLILDGIESILDPEHQAGTANFRKPKKDQQADFQDDAIKEFFRRLLEPGTSSGKCLVTSHFRLSIAEGSTAQELIDIDPLNDSDSAELFRQLGITIPEISAKDTAKGMSPEKAHVKEFGELHKATAGYPLDIALTAAALKDAKDPTLTGWRTLFGTWRKEISKQATFDGPEPHEVHANRVMSTLYQRLSETDNQLQVELVRLVATLAPGDDNSAQVLLDAGIERLTGNIQKAVASDRKDAEAALREKGLMEFGLTAHGRVRTYFGRRFAGDHPDAWDRANQLLFEHHLEKAIKFEVEHRNEKLNAAEQRCMNAAKSAVFYGCRRQPKDEETKRFALQSAFTVYMMFLKGDHVIVDKDKDYAEEEVIREYIALRDDKVVADASRQSSDTFPRIGSYAENLSLLRNFFERATDRRIGSDWASLPEGLSKKASAQVFFDAAFALRAQGRLTQAADCYEEALNLRREIFDAGDKSVEVCKDLSTSYGSFAKVLIMQGRGQDAVDQANAGANLPFLNESDLPFEYTSIMADLGAAQHIAGNPKGAHKAYVDSRDKKILSASKEEILYAERMVQYCDYLLDLGDHQKAETVLRKADEVLEALGDEELFLRYRLDYAINGYIHGRILVVKYDEKTLFGNREAISASFLNELQDCVQDGTGRAQEQKRLSRIDNDVSMHQRNLCSGDIIHARKELELISRRDWLVKVYTAAAGVARAVAIESPESEALSNKADHYLSRAGRLADPLAKGSIDEIEFKPFYIDFLIEAAKHVIQLQDRCRDTICKLLGKSWSKELASNSSGTWGRAAAEILGRAERLIEEAPGDYRHQTEQAKIRLSRLLEIANKPNK